MSNLIHDFLKTASDPIPDSIYGEGYRCSAYLVDGVYLPCVMLRKNAPVVDLAVRRFEQEKHGKSVFKSGDGYRAIVKSFITSGNKVNYYDIAKLEPSKYAIPLALLKQVEGETTMSWTGFVLEMKDGALISFGTTFLMAFFDIPDDYTFSDVVAVHNHSYVSPLGELKRLHQGMSEQPKDYNLSLVRRERPYFVCYYGE